MSEITAEPVARLIDEFNKLPGIGPKTAQRLTFYLLRMPADQARGLAEAILDVKERVGFCSVCFNMTEEDPCWVCRGERDRTTICVVEEPLDVLALERTRVYKGMYHVLHGAISPMEGIGPEDIRLRELLARLNDGVSEVILAMNADLEGEATARYVTKLVRPLGVRVTWLSRGLSAGSDLEYADEVTLTRALEGRREVQ